MNEREERDMQRRIDKGILLAQTRLMERARHDNFTLIVCRNGRIVDVPVDEL